jgi:hypothetical protein
MARQQHAFGAERRRAQAAEHTWAAAVGQHMHGEHVLPDPGCCQENPFGLQLRQCTSGMPGDLFPRVRLQQGNVELFLAQEGQLAAMLQSEEVRQTPGSYALGAGCVQ